MKSRLYQFYLGICLLALAAFTYAEYNGYLLTGSDETSSGSSGNHSRINHK